MDRKGELVASRKTPDEGNKESECVSEEPSRSLRTKGKDGQPEQGLGGEEKDSRKSGREGTKRGGKGRKDAAHDVVG